MDNLVRAVYAFYELCSEWCLCHRCIVTDSLDNF